MRRVFASDFDGTLYFMDRPERISSADIAAIEAYQRRGGLFGVCTGRSLQGVLLPVGEAVRFDFYILASGALILDGALRVVDRRRVSRELLAELCARYRGHELVVQANDTVYTFGRPYPMQTKIAALDDIGSDDLYGVSIAMESVEAARRLTEEINAAYADALLAHQNVTNVDVAPKGCSKGSALEVVRARFAAERVGAIGDARNDLPMLERADMAFTFPGAPEKVRERADHIVSSVSEALSVFSSD